MTLSLPTPSPHWVRYAREVLPDPTAWIDCETCGGAGVIGDDPYDGYGRVCGECGGEGGEVSQEVECEDVE